MRYVLKLNKLKVNIAVLKETGVGRLVNKLCAYPGCLGKKSRQIVRRWRYIVQLQENPNMSAYHESYMYTLFN